MVGIKKLLVGFAEFYGQTLTETRLNILAEVLADLDPKDVERAMRGLMHDPEIKFMPLPAVIREIARPTISVEQGVQLSLSRLPQAVRDCGYYQPNAARNFLGEAIWRAVGGTAGWEQYCQLAVGDTTAFTAQTRDRLRAILHSENPTGRIGGWDDSRLLQSANQATAIGVWGKVLPE